MKNWKGMLTAMGLVSLSFVSQAQSGTVKGQVAGAGRPVESASVGLLRAKDSAVVKMSVTDKNGAFGIENINNGRYLVAVQSVGFQKYYSEAFEITAAQPAYTLKAIQLQAAAKNLQDVTVSSKRPMIEQKLDRTVINVDASPSNAGTNVLELLEKSPGISVDKDGNISLKGKQGVMVMVDGKPTYLGAQDLANMLRNMPSAQLDQIEIMTNPPARFDASGNSGVINIKTKKTKTMGYNASITSTYGQGVYPKLNNSINLNYRQGKMNFFGNASQGYNENFGNMHIVRNFRNQSGDLLSVFDQNALNNRKNNNISYKAGFDYFMNKKTTLGMVVNGFGFRGDEYTDNTTFIKDKNGALTTRTQATNETHMKFGNVGVNLNLRHVFDSTGRELTMDADYVNYTQDNNQLLGNKFYDHNGNVKSPDEMLRGILPSNINIYSFKADYSQKMKGEMRFEAGVKTSYVNTDNDARYANWNGTQFVTDINRSNHFLYKENINAAYLNLNKQFSKKWSGQLGLRAENTNLKGNQLTTGQVFERNYTQVFPTVYIGFAPNDKNQFALSFGRRIDRPNYQDLNPFYYFLDKYTYQVGNPYLQPQFSKNIELTHNFRGILNTSLNYSHTDNIIQDVMEQVDSNNTTFIKKSNIARRDNFGLSISLGAPVTKWWRANVYLNGVYNKFKGIVNGGEIEVDGVMFMGNMNNQFTLGKGWGAELSGFFRSRSIEGVLVARSMGAVNIGFSKQILKNQGTLRLVVRDVFLTQQFRGYSKYQNVDVTLRQLRDSRVVNLSFTYRFSKGKTAAQRKRGGANEEQNRVNMGGGN